MYDESRPRRQVHGTAFASFRNISEASVVLLTVLILLILSVLILVLLVLSVLILILLALLILSVLILLILIVIIEHGVYFLFKKISENSLAVSLSS